MTSLSRAEWWHQQPRRLHDFTVKSAHAQGDSVGLIAESGIGFSRDKAELGRDIAVGEKLQVEVAHLSVVTGLRDKDDWLFRLTNEELARQHDRSRR